MSTEHIRITSVYDRARTFVTFKGVPLQKGSPRVSSGRYHVSIRVPTDRLPVTPQIGQHWEISGDVTVERKDYGNYTLDEHKYANPKYLNCLLPEDGEQFIQFIAKNPDFEGIGEARARELWATFGTNIHSHLQNDCPENRFLLSELLTQKSCDALFKGYEKYANLAHCNWLSQHNVPANIQHRLLKHHSDKAVIEIKKNPYLLISFGMSFSELDQIARDKFGIQTGDHRRLSAALQSALVAEVDNGHTYSATKHLKPRLNKLLGDRQLVDRALSVGFSKAQYLKGPTGHFHPTAQYLMEAVIARRLLALASMPVQTALAEEEVIETATASLAYPLTSRQLEAVRCSLQSSVSCITGGAGTGKTTVLRTVLSAYTELGYIIHAVALSGRASMRLHESTGFETCTIAKLLHGGPITQKKSILVIDESSMIDVPTLYQLVILLNPAIRLLFVGDPNQLPPIGCGKVLADIVEAGTIPNTTLDLVQRQSGDSGIPVYSRAISAGTPPAKLSTGAITFHEIALEDIAAKCSDLYCESPSTSRVVGSTKKIVSDINQLIQNGLNSFGRRMQFEIHGDQFYCEDLREGDAVLFNKNHYTQGIQNGSLGVLTSVDTTEDTFGTVVLDSGNQVVLTLELIECMERGYCITLHKAQGSQFFRVIVALAPGRIVDRAWIYTAVTRAEAEVHIVGRAEDLRNIVEQPSKSMNRRSFLAKLLNT